MYYIILRVYMLNNYSVDQWPQLLSSRAAYFPLMLHPKVKRAVDINSSLWNSIRDWPGACGCPGAS